LLNHPCPLLQKEGRLEEVWRGDWRKFGGEIGGSFEGRLEEVWRGVWRRDWRKLEGIGPLLLKEGMGWLGQQH